MNFNDKRIFDLYLKSLNIIGVGSQGVIYYDKTKNICIKVFHEYFDNEIEDNRDDILRFSHINNKTFIWPKDVVTVQGVTVGYTTNYIKANNLYKQDPLEINLNQFISAVKKTNNDIKKLTNNNIRIYDIMYNILYARSNFYVVDTDEYSNNQVKFIDNAQGFNKEIKLFLVNGYFDYFVKQNRLLNKMYEDKDADILEFINLFKSSLQEVNDKEITKLKDARKLIKRASAHTYYQREVR